MLYSYGWLSIIMFHYLVTIESSRHACMQVAQGYRLVLRELGDTCPNLLTTGSLVQIWGDNQGAISAAQHMRGRVQLALVAELHMEAFQSGLSLSLVWCPRETAQLKRADALSKPSDPSDWQLSRARGGRFGAEACAGVRTSVSGDPGSSPGPGQGAFKSRYIRVGPAR
jgi:hypothetical protein